MESRFSGELRRELDAVQPGEARLERLIDRLEAEGPSKPAARRRGRGAVAALVACAALMVTAAAAGPGIWEALQARLGTLAPYAVPAEGTAADQGIEVKLVGSISDGYTARAYFTATDLTGGRFNDHTDVEGMLKGTGTGVAQALGGCRIKSYDAALNQFLLEAKIEGVDASQLVTLELTSFNPGYRYTRAIFQAPASAETLKTAETEEGETVLLPEQNPQKSPEAEGVCISSMGFDGDGVFHVRIGLDKGYRTDQNGRSLSVLPESKSQPNTAVYQQDGSRTLVEGGIDYQFPNLTADQLDDLDYVQLYGLYQGPEEAIKGSWSIPVTLEPAEQRELDMDRQVGNFQVDRVVFSPLSIAAFYNRLNGEGGFLHAAQAVLKDGTQAELEMKMGSAEAPSGSRAYSLWEFSEPVELDEIASIRLLGEEIWTNPN